MHPKPADLPDHNRRYHRVLPELFAGVNVGKMHLYSRQTNRHKAVSNGDAVVRVGTGVDYNSVGPVRGVLNGVDNSPFRVGLEYADLHTELFGGVGYPRIYLIQRGWAVNFRFPYAQQIEIRTMNHKYAHDTSQKTFSSGLQHLIIAHRLQCQQPKATLPFLLKGIEANILKPRLMGETCEAFTRSSQKHLDSRQFAPGSPDRIESQ